MTQNFPKNTEMEAELTFVVQPGVAALRGRRHGRPAERRRGRRVSSKACARWPQRPKPPPSACTTRSSSCPTANYKPRACDPRSGYMDVSFKDYSAPLGTSQHARSPGPAPAAEEGPDGRHQRPGEADCLLPRSRRSRADPLGAARRRALVEPGVRGGRLPQRVSRRAAARRRQPARHPLQRHQLGAPLDARLEHRRRGHRSAHRRDHQGRRHARLAAHPAGLHDRRGPAVALQDGHRDAARAEGVGARAHPPALRARGRPHARPRPQLLRQHRRPHLGDGLPAPARHAQARRHVRLLEGLRPSASASGTRSPSPTATRTSLPARTSRRRWRASSTRRGRRTCSTSRTRTSTRTRGSISGRTAPTPRPSSRG